MGIQLFIPRYTSGQALATTSSGLAAPARGCYFYAGGTRVAMHAGSTRYYLLSDHLSSTTVTSDRYGDSYSELRYMPWGENRYSDGTTPTDFRFTGQKEESELGLYFYNARWYDPEIGRFIQADSIVPDPGNPQAWDRFAYVLNNPVKYVDPSGHRTCTEAQAETGDETCNQNYNADDLIGAFSYLYRWIIVGEWTVEQLVLLHSTARDIREYVQGLTGESGREWMRANLGGITLHNMPDILARSYVLGSHVMLDFSDINGDKRLIAHEIAHALDNKASLRSCPAIFCGGGLSDILIMVLGGKPGIIPVIDNGPSTLPEKYQFNEDIPYGYYGNKSTVEYFTVGFSALLYKPRSLHATVKSYFDAIILMLAQK